MNINKIFANEDSIVDLSSLGSKNEVKIVISGPDMNIVTPHGTTVIVNGALYSSIKGNKLSVKFNDGSVSGSQLVSSVDLKNIKLDRLDSTLVESDDSSYKKNIDAKNKAEAVKEQAKLQQKIEEAKKAEEAADKAKNEADKAISEMVEAQNSSKEIENMLSDFLGNIASKGSMAQVSDNQEIEVQDAKVAVQDEVNPIPIKPININTGKGRSNSSSKSDHISDEPVKPKNISVSLKLENDSNSGSKNDTLTNVGMPKFIGTTEPNSSIIIKLDKISIGQLVSDSLGNFEFSSPIELDEGNYVFSVDATDESGAVGSAQLTIAVDKSTIAPTFELSAEDKAVAGHNLTAKLNPTIKGTAEKGAVVEIYVGSKLVASVNVNELGEWEHQLKNGVLAEGNNAIKLIAIDKADNRATINGTIELDSIPPEKPTVLLDEQSDSGLKKDNVTNIKQLVFVGESESGSKVSLFLGNKHLADVIADENGGWRFAYSSQLTDGNYTLRAIASDLAGNKSEESSLNFEIDTIISKFSAAILDKDDSAIVGDNITNVRNPNLSGMTEPGCEIEVTNKNTGEMVKISSDKKGIWNLSFLKDSDEGINNLIFNVTDKAGNSGEYSFSYHVDTIAPIAPIVALDSFVILPNGKIATSKNLPVFIGSAEPGTTVLIMVDGRANISVKVASSGKWEFSFPDKFPDGNYSIDFLVQDTAGNKSPKQNHSFTVQTTTAIPTAQLDPDDDSGAKGDWITNKQSGLTLAGSAQQYATVKVYIGNKLVGTTNADDAGQWKLDIDQSYPDKEYKVKIEAVDKLNFTSSAGYDLVIDSVIIQPSIKLHDSSDTGIKDNNITKVVAPLFTGISEANSKVTLYVNGILQGETVAGEDGIWNITNKTNLIDGVHHAVVKAEDAAGNKKDSLSYKFEVISSTLKPTIKLLNDTGFDAKDNITQENKLNLSGTAAANATVKIFSGTKLVGNTVANKEGNWTFKFNDTNKLEDGEYSLSASVEDAAGNTAGSDTLVITVDTSLSIPTIELSSASDSGELGDNLTHFSKPILLIKNTDPDIREVQIWNELTNLQIGVATRSNKGIWSYTFTDELSHGEHQFYVKAEDNAGNQRNSLPLVLTVDTQLLVPTIALMTGEDSGTNKTDNRTNHKQPKFILDNIDTDVDQSNIKVEVTHNNKTEILLVTKAAGKWGATPSADWEDGDYQLKVSVTDKAGNQQTSAQLDVRIDTTVAKPIIALDIGQDTGSDITDKLTNLTQPKFVIHTDEDVEKVQVKTDSGQWIDATPDGPGAWRYTPSTPLSADKHQLEVRVTDKAGNEARESLVFTIDNSVTKPSIALAAGQDTGSVSTDGLTNKKQPIFNLGNIDTDVDKASIQVNVIHNNKTEALAVTKDAGKWVATPSADWEDGDYQLAVIVKDKAGNTETSDKLKVQIDTTVAKPIIALATGQDTGSDSTDNLTNLTQPKFVIRTDEDVTTLLVKTDNDQWVNAILDGPGVWSYTPSTPLAENAHQLEVKATDKAGNEASQSLTFNIDTSLSKPTIALAAGQDTGNSTTDNLTYKKLPIFNLDNIDDDADKVMVIITGSKTQTVEAKKDSQSGKWSFTADTEWKDGDYQLKVEVTDKAGNTKSSDELKVEVDTTLNKPIMALDAGQDTGSDNNDKLTNLTQPKFVINTDSDVATLQVKTDSGQWVNATAVSSGVWSYTPHDSLLHGKHRLEVKAIDKAGNESHESIDVTVDTRLSTPKIELASGQTKVDMGNDHHTNIKQPNFIINDIDDDFYSVKLKVIHNGKTELINIAKTSGQWGFSPKQEWSDGEYKLEVVVVDNAGNERTSAPYSVVINTKTSVGGIKLVNDTGKDTGDNLTKENLPEFEINVPLNVEQVRVSVDDGKTWVKLPAGKDGVWAYTATNPLPEKEHTLKVEAIDFLGNKATGSQMFKIDHTLEIPTIELAAGEDTGSSATDGLTNKSLPKFNLKNIASDVIEVKVNVKDMVSGKSTPVEAKQDSQSGQWEFTLPQKLDDSSHQLTVTVTDKAGNERTSAELKVGIDTLVSKPGIKLAAGQDTGSSDSDNLTNKTLPIFDLYDIDKDVVKVQLEVNVAGKSETVDAVQDKTTGKWSFTPSAAWENKSYQLTVKVEDKAGNQNSSLPLVVEIDTVFDINGINLINASGAKYSANLTNQTKPEFLIDVPADTDTVEASVDGSTWTKANLNAKGQWVMAISSPLEHNNYNLQVKATDKAGNSANKDFEFQIDTKLSTPTIKLGADQDSGVSDKDFITFISKPKFEIDNIDEDVTRVTVKIGKDEYPATQINDKWIFQPSAGLQAGKYGVTVEVADKAGNIRTSSSLALEIDTSTEVTKIDITNDNGTSANDYILSNKIPEFDIILPKDVYSVKVSLTGKDNDWTTVNKNTQGKWLFTSPKKLENKEYTLHVKVIDTAGNEASKQQKFTIDTELSTPTLKLSTNSDSGKDTSDNLTKINKPTFIFDNIDSDVDKVEINIDGKDYPASNGVAGWSFTPSTPLNDGKRNIKVTVTDIAGNSRTSDVLTIEIDTRTDIKEIKLVNDSGISNIDGLTQNTRPSFDIKVEKDVNSVQVSFDGKTWQDATKKDEVLWSFVNPADLKEGSYTLQVKATDNAGNNANKSLSFVIDTHVDGLKIEMPDDTGKKPGGHITNVTQPRFNFLANEALETVVVTLNGDKTILQKDAGGAWQFIPNTPLGETTHKLVVTATDKAGNTSTDNISFDIDTTLNTPEVDLKDSDDSGDSKTDNITNVKRPTFIISQVPTDIDEVSITINGVKHTVKPQANGSYQFKPSGDLSDANYEAVVTFTDTAGNKKETKLPFTIDTSVHLTTKMDPASDSGSSKSDNLTNRTQPKFIVAADPDSTMEVTITNNTNSQQVYQKSVTMSKSGSWDCVPDTLVDGNYTLKVTARDTTGNTETSTTVFTIDTTTADSTIKLVSHEADDEFLATNLFPEFTGTAEALSSVILSVDGNAVGTAKVDTNGVWSWTPATALAGGNRLVSVVATDKAGNESKATNISVKIPYLDVEDPTIKLDEKSDSGTLGDFVTSKKQPTISGLALPNAEVTIYLNNAKIDSVFADPSGNYSYTLPTNPEGSYNLKVGIKDPRDAKEIFSPEVELVIDTQVKDITWEIPKEYRTDAGYIRSDTPLVKGTSEPNSKVTILVNGKEHDTVYASALGKWKILLAPLGGNGKYTIAIQVEDVAGNKKTFDSKEFILDTWHDTFSVNLKAADDTGAKNNDLLTNKNTVILEGKSEAGATIYINNPDTHIGQNVTADVQGNWSATVTLVEGKNNFELHSQDLANNNKYDSISIVLDTSLSIPEISLSGESNTGDRYDLVTSKKGAVLVTRTEPFASVEVIINDKSQGNVAADSSGKVTFKLPDDSSDGEYNVKFIVTDIAGNKAESPVAKVIIDSNISSFAVDSIPAQTNQRGLPVSGKGEPDARIEIYVNGVITGSTTVDKNGIWSTSVALKTDGDHKIKIKISDIAGNFKESEEFSVKLDSLIAAPTIQLSPATNSGAVDDSVTNFNKPTLIGTAKAGATVTLFKDDQEFAKVTADDKGIWSYQCDDVLKDGEYYMHVTAQDKAGNTANSHRLSMTIDTDTFVHLPVMVDESRYTGMTMSDIVSKTAKPIFRIDAELRQYVEVFIDGKLVDKVLISKSGQHYEIPTELSDGKYIISYSITDKAGNKAKSEEVPFIVDTSNDIPVTLDTVKGATDDSIIERQGKTYIRDVSNEVTLRGKADAHSRLEIKINGFNTPNVWSDKDGNWSLKVNLAEFSEGKLTINMKSTDRGGHTNSGVSTLWLDTGISEFTCFLKDNETPDKTLWSSGKDITVMHGKGEVGATISLTHDNKLIDSTVVGADGTWQISTDKLQNGESKIILTIKDLAEHTKSEHKTIFIDRSIPEAPEITDSLILSNGLIVISGTTVGASWVYLKDKDGKGIDTIIVDATTGVWRVTIDYPPEGKVNIFSKSQIGRYSEINQLDLIKQQGVITLEAGSDTGIAGDNITNHKKPTFIIGDIDNDVISVVLDIGGNNFDANKGADGKWTYTPDSELKHGTYTITATITDSGKNTTISKSYNFGIEAPQTQPEIQAIPVDTTEVSGASLVMKRSAGDKLIEPDSGSVNTERKEDEYLITLLESSEGGSVTKLQNPIFEISVPKDVISVSVALDGREHELTVIDHKAIFQAPMPSEDGEYTLEVRFTDKDASFIIKDKVFTIDNSSDDIVNSMAGNGKTTKPTGTSGSASGQHGHDISEIFTHSSANYIAPIDEVNDYY